MLPFCGSASPSQIGRFETQWLAASVNHSLLPIFSASGSTLCVAEGRLVASYSTWSRDEPDSWLGGELPSGTAVSRAPRYHPSFVFNQFGDLERCSLRPATFTAPTNGTLCSSAPWRATTARPRASISGLSPLCQSRALRVSRGGEDQVYDPAAGEPGLRDRTPETSLPSIQLGADSRQ